jgi:hypothetical protein
VQSDEDTSQPDDRRADEKERPGSSTAEQGNREGNRKGGHRMVAWKGGLVRRRREKKRLRRMGDKRSFPDPDVRDRLSDEKSEAG